MIKQFHKKDYVIPSFLVVELSSSFLAANDFISFDIPDILRKTKVRVTQRFMSRKKIGGHAIAGAGRDAASLIKLRK